jgi:hypothetical protein
MLSRIGEHVAYSRRSHADKHLQKLRPRDGDEWDIRLAGRGLGQHRFARTRRTGEDGAFGDFGAQLNVLLWILQEVDKLHDFDFGLFATGDVPENHTKCQSQLKESRALNSLEAHVNLARINQLGRRLHDAAKESSTFTPPTTSAHHLGRSSHHENQKTDYQERRQQSGQR